MLRVDGLEVAYGAVRALAGVSLEVRAGEIVTLVGSNGAGKSTTLRAISGLVPVRSGSITLEGRSLVGLPADRIVALGVAHSPEGRRVFTRLSVRENLEMGAYLRRDRAEVAQSLERAFTLFPRLREREAQAAGTLSGGEQQMLAIARALMSRPRLLLLDEPSLGIAPLLVQEIFREVVRINRETGTAILLVEQNAYAALGIAHRAYVLETGRIVLEGDAAQLRDHPQVKAAYLG
ncbi:MAG: ABC transporter ATP-binding protein [Planctomycetia bacterium]